ncbi:MAG: hypothetical protein V3S12_05605 [Acidiferrobacterales bacterium]
MKTNPQYVNGYKAPGYHAKIPLDSWTRRIIWFLWRRYCLNEDYYRVVIRFTGPRPRGTNQASTLKANATAFRYYLEPRRRIRSY